jgi:(p)ppGpp synthase/HD superfamily hydrolase
MNFIEKAIELALRAHTGQVDKGGEPYIQHPLRLMLRMDGEAEAIAAALHDVVEDANVGLDDLRASGFPEEAIQAIDCLTKRAGEDYEAFIRRVDTNEIARKVKIADLEDNLNIARIPELTTPDLERVTKYHRALRWLRRSETS